MHTQRVTRLSATLIISAMGLMTSAGNAGLMINLDDPPTMQEAVAYIQAANWAEAISAYRAILKADATNAQAQFMLGYALHASGDIGNAILAHKKATKMPEVAALAYYNLGCAYAIQGETTDAIEALESAITLGIRDKDQYAQDPDLKSLHADERWKPLIDSIAKLDKAEAAMHFWVGSWDCYDSSTGVLAGKNTLSFRVGKNVIHESWTAAGQTNTDESWNVFNRQTLSWEQTWVDHAGNLLHVSAPASSDEYEGLMFVGENISPMNQMTGSKMHVRPYEDGYVLQTGYSSKDEGKTWTQVYEFVYVPAGEPFEPKVED